MLSCFVQTGTIAALSSKDPFPTAASLLSGAADQRALPSFPFLNCGFFAHSPRLPRPVLILHMAALPYPGMCLLIAAMHERTAGNDSFTFEMLYYAFQTQVRTSTSAPVQNRYGGSIGMVGCGRAILLTVRHRVIRYVLLPMMLLTQQQAFERLVDVRLFVTVAGASAGSARQFVFVKHRCMVEYVQVKAAVDASKQTSLQKWLKKAS
jgi:origin recognition complex subunit 4